MGDWPVRQVVDIERLVVWTYQQQAADRVVARQGGRFYPSGGGGDSVAAVARRMSLGVSIDCAGSVAYDAGHLHPDADMVHARVVRFPSLVAGMIIRHGRAGTRPDWEEGGVRLRPILRGNGKPRIVYHDTGGRYPAYCPVVADPCADHVEFARGQYVAWWDGLNALAADLDGLLRDHVVTPPNTPRTPWTLDSREKV